MLSWFASGEGLVGMDARHVDMPASIAERCAGRANITADMLDVDIVAGTGIAGIGEAATFTHISIVFLTGTTILTVRAATIAHHSAANGIADAYGIGDIVTAITEAACVTMVAAHAE